MQHIGGDNNTQFSGNNNIVGEGNNVTHNHFYNNKQGEPLEKVETLPITLKVYRRKSFLIDGLFIILGIFSFISIEFYRIGIEMVFISVPLLFILWILIPQVIGSLYITIHSQGFTINDREIKFKNIRWYQYQGNIFSYKFHEDDKTHSIEFYSSEKSEYLFYKMDQYATFYKTKV